MNLRKLLLIAALGVSAALVAGSAQATERTLMGAIAYQRAQTQPWHGPYYHTMWGSPVALVVPPTAELQTNWGWGVGNTRITPIYHQFQRPLPATAGGWGFQPTPIYRTDTVEAGVYYVRGPW